MTLVYTSVHMYLQTYKSTHVHLYHTRNSQRSQLCNLSKSNWIHNRYIHTYICSFALANYLHTHAQKCTHVPMHVCIYIHLFMYRARYIYVCMCVCVSSRPSAERRLWRQIGPRNESSRPQAGLPAQLFPVKHGLFSLFNLQLNTLSFFSGSNLAQHWPS